MKAEVIQTTRKGKSILWFFPLFWTIPYNRFIPIHSYNNAITQCHVDSAQRAWATCDKIREKYIRGKNLKREIDVYMLWSADQNRIYVD